WPRLLCRRPLPADDPHSPDPPLRPLRRTKGRAYMTSSKAATQPAANAALDQKRRALLAPRLLGSPARWIALILGVLILLAFFFTSSDRWMIVVNYALIAALAALALNVLSGYAGQISLGIAFFMAIGAYTAAFLGGDPPSSSTEPLGLGLSFVI